MPVSVMFVCLGNICRSPLAHGLFEKMVRQAGMDREFEIASSGTGAWHIGQRPDARMRRTARRHECSLDHLRAQQFKAEDLHACDYVFAMDRQNLDSILRLDTTGEHRSKVQLFREDDPIGRGLDVPDPYYAGRFEEVYQMVERTCRVILQRLITAHGMTSATGSSRAPVG